MPDPDLISDPAAFAALWRDYEHTAFRLESRPAYVEPDETEPIARWRAGQPDDQTWRATWLAGVRQATTAGRRMSRVRIYDHPATEYQRWLASVTPANIAAGEDIRYLPRARAADLAIEQTDWWLFDNRRATVLVFAADGRRLGYTLITDPHHITRYRAARDTLWRHATPFDQVHLVED
jgi:hypothetical protein